MPAHRKIAVETKRRVAATLLAAAAAAAMPRFANGKTIEPSIVDICAKFRSENRCAEYDSRRSETSQRVSRTGAPLRESSSEEQD